ncbi:MAG: hypothetical protein ACOC56_02150 [Atribacterota bacterium]
MKKTLICMITMLSFLLPGCSMATSKNSYENKKEGPSMEYKGPSEYNRTRIEIRKGESEEPTAEVNSYDKEAKQDKDRKFRITKKSGRIIVEVVD